MNRREFMRLLGIAGVNASAYVACSTYMREAMANSTVIQDLASIPIDDESGSLEDIEHVILFMQENRSLDHYFGTLRGVRGFGDPRPLTQQWNGKPVWEQSQISGGNVIFGFNYYTARPFQLEQPNTETSQVFLIDPPHHFLDSTGATNKGKMDSWLAQKGEGAFCHYSEKDLPLYFQLAKAFTVCDANFCSLNGPTDPNRSFYFTGTSSQLHENLFFSLKQGTVFSFADNLLKLDWKTYPEHLDDLGVTWKMYQEGPSHDEDRPFEGNYNCNTVKFFNQCAKWANASLYDKVNVTNKVLRTVENVPSQLEQDVINDALPAVSWIIAPEAFTEHPKYPPYFGEFYIHEILRCLAANPKVWRKTAFIITFDENGGFFDHVPPPTPPLRDSYGKVSPEINVETKNFISPDRRADIENTIADITDGRLNALMQGQIGEPVPAGLGSRVPMLVISPWSIGGRVCSEVFDHTSNLKFVETWLRAKGKITDDKPYERISSWRHHMTGDLTSAFDFKRPSNKNLSEHVKISKKVDFLTKDAKENAKNASKHQPLRNPTLEPAHIRLKQDQAQVELLPTGYDFQVYCTSITGRTNSDCNISFKFCNYGKLGAPFTIYDYVKCKYYLPTRNYVYDGPWFYSVAGLKSAQKEANFLEDTWSMALDWEHRDSYNNIYHYVVHAPNGYLAEFSGNFASSQHGLCPEILSVRPNHRDNAVTVTFTKWPSANGKLKLVNAYNGLTKIIESGTTKIDLVTLDGWYDFSLSWSDDPSLFLRRWAGHVENGKISKTDPAIGKLYNTTTLVYDN